jgi:hypothetical protein
MRESLIASDCPADPHGKAEDYLLGHLPADEANALERHFIVCSTCLCVLEKENAIILAFKGAAASIRG